MAHYAQLEATQDPNLFTVVQNVVAEADFIATGALGDPAFWMQNSYNTRGGVHYDANGIPDAEGFRGNFAGIGYIYDKANDVFYAPQPSPEYVLDTDTWIWWNPNDPEQSKPVKAVIVPPIVEQAVPPLVPQSESVIDVAAEEVPAETTIEAPVEAPVESPVEPVVETPVETPAEAPVEPVAEVPAEVAPEETPK